MNKLRHPERGQHKNELNELGWVISKERSNSPFPKRSYEIDSRWVGINLFSIGRKRDNPLDAIEKPKPT